MASIRLQPPAPFPFHQPDEWTKWKRRFEQFRSASGLAAERDEERQISTLLYTMGEEAGDILMSTNISEADIKKYKEVMGKFDEFFGVRKNVIFERARFNRRCQNEGESVEQFITNLYQLAENCQYGGMKAEMIRDRIVVGIKDVALSQKLQLDPDLTLEKAKTQVRQREAVQEHQQQIKEGFKPTKTPTAVDAVRRQHQPQLQQATGGKTTNTYQQIRHNKPGHATPDKCFRCGKGFHPRQQCPAKDVTCHSCGKRGHYSSCCLSKPTHKSVRFTKGVNDVSEEEASDNELCDTVFLNTIGSNKDDKSWMSKIRVNDHEVCFKLDTGAEVSVLTEETMNSLRVDRKQLKKSTKRLMGADKTPLNVTCEFVACLEYKGRKTEQTMFVVKKATKEPLGVASN